MCARLIVGDSVQSQSVINVSNDRIFSLNHTFPDLPQYPHIFHILYKFLLNKSTDLSYISSSCLPPYLQEVGAFGRF